MIDVDLPRVVIIDYRMGNVFSVKNACNSVGLNAEITSSKKDILDADAVILPGVGAFGDAMQALYELDLVETIKDAALSKPFLGICLGMQLLMSASYEFGYHQGLGIINGDVVRFETVKNTGGRLIKVPHIGWNYICKTEENDSNQKWEDSLLKELQDEEFMYFAHSYYVRPEDSDMVLSLSRYGSFEFCSSLSCNNIFACQFHPERSGAEGLKIYRNLKESIKENKIKENLQND